jgi:hypothetical protein
MRELAIKKISTVGLDLAERFFSKSTLSTPIAQ